MTVNQTRTGQAWRRHRGHCHHPRQRRQPCPARAAYLYVRPHDPTMHVLLNVGELRGEPQFEPVHVEELSEGVLKLLFSPGLAYDIAAGDTIKVDESGHYDVVQRAGNLAIRLYFKEPVGDRLTKLEQEFAAMNGTLDGQVRNGAVFTVSASGHVPKVRRVMNDFVKTNKDCIWEFGNAYDSQGKPLDWCKQLLGAGEA